MSIYGLNQNLLVQNIFVTTGIRQLLQAETVVVYRKNCCLSSTPTNRSQVDSGNSYNARMTTEKFESFSYVLDRVDV